MNTEKFNLIFKQYPEEMKLSNEKRTIYLHFSEGDRLPKNIRNSLHSKDFNGHDSVGALPGLSYYVGDDGWIFNKAGEKVIRNARTAGKPNMKKISGQAIWSGSINMYARNNMKKFLTGYFSPFITRTLPYKLVTPAGYYFHFEFIFYVPIVMRNWAIQDLDNHAFPYIKAFMDTLTLLEVIPDDDARYFRGYYPRYVNCQDEEQRRLEIKIHFCRNDERIS